MKRRFIAIFLLSFCLLTDAYAASKVALTDLRVWDSPQGTRIVLDTSHSADYVVFTLDSPKRVVIDLKQTELKARFPKTPSDSVIRDIRSGLRNNGRDLRVVLDVASMQTVNSFALDPHGQYGHRVVVEIDGQTEEDIPVLSKPAPQNTGKPRDIVVAIDAGHGGEDPGASGRYGTREKDVVLKIAKRLKAHLEKEPGIRPVMIRTGDYYVGLRQRIALARKHRADLFVSIHADAFKNRRVKGSSVYVLSPEGGSSETAKWLEKQENAADLVGGVRIDDKDPTLAKVILELSLAGTIDVSTQVADKVLSEFKSVTHLHKNSVQSAGFVVLKSPDIPSMLIETAFISNPTEERNLKDRRYQDKLARAITRGVRKYFENSPPPGTMFAARGQRAHVVRPGETLSSIAQQYRVSLRQLRDVNDLQRDMIRSGEQLQIPVL